MIEEAGVNPTKIIGNNQNHNNNNNYNIHEQVQSSPRGAASSIIYSNENKQGSDSVLDDNFKSKKLS